MPRFLGDVKRCQLEPAAPGNSKKAERQCLHWFTSTSSDFCTDFGRTAPGAIKQQKPEEQIPDPGLLCPGTKQLEVINSMNTDMLKGDWTNLKGKIKEKWGKLTDDDLTVIEGKRDQIAGKLQERYGYAK